jgi:hypothetical protein
MHLRGSGQAEGTFCAPKAMRGTEGRLLLYLRYLGGLGPLAAPMESLPGRPEAQIRQKLRRQT